MKKNLFLLLIIIFAFPLTARADIFEILENNRKNLTDWQAEATQKAFEQGDFDQTSVEDVDCLDDVWNNLPTEQDLEDYLCEQADQMLESGKESINGFLDTDFLESFSGTDNSSFEIDNKYDLQSTSRFNTLKQGMLGE
jgi:hypothetical protein